MKFQEIALTVTALVSCVRTAREDDNGDRSPESGNDENVYVGETTYDGKGGKWSIGFSPKGFVYNIHDGGWSNRKRIEERGDDGSVRGMYSYIDQYGLYRKVYYVADENGFRPSIASNEPGVGISYPGPTNQGPIPSLRYEIEDKDGNSEERFEERSDDGSVRGRYSLRVQGLQRIVRYVADENGFRAWIESNEPGVDVQSSPADANYTQFKEPDSVPYAAKGDRGKYPLAQFYSGSLEKRKQFGKLANEILSER